MDVLAVLEFIGETMDEANQARPSKYRDGYLDALGELKEFIQDSLWYEGEDA